MIHKYLFKAKMSSSESIFVVFSAQWISDNDEWLIITFLILDFFFHDIFLSNAFTFCLS